MEYDPAIGAKVLIAATRFVGLCELVSGVKEVQRALDEEVKVEMLKVGWATGWPYGMGFCDAVWKKAYQGRIELVQVREMLEPSVMQTWKNAVEAGWTSVEPRVGAIGCMRKGNSDLGHAFVVEGWSEGMIWTMEGGEDGEDLVKYRGNNLKRKSRKDELRPTAGLHVLGYILPMS